ncbi:MAG: type II toxin-antitoxin system VapC family toxin [Kiritimatiellae bacterium]|nr:type II toxin-antitoxin system VapC family toxin [Kiritimatiellia bacterium]
MGLSHLLDTSVFSQPIKDRPVASVMARWSALGDEAVCTSALCQAELLQGLEQRGSEKYWRRYRELLAERYSVLPFDAVAAASFGSLAAELKRMGRPKPTIDLLIAATAKRHGLIVATLNAKDFKDIPGLAVEDWG